MSFVSSACRAGGGKCAQAGLSAAGPEISCCLPQLAYFFIYLNLLIYCFKSSGGISNSEIQENDAVLPLLKLCTLTFAR